MRIAIRVGQLLILCVVVCAALVVVYLADLTPTPRALGNSHAIPPFAHVFVIMMENQSPAVLNNPAAPYLRSLAQRYATDSTYFGVTHSSLPNYVAAISGTTAGAHLDTPTQRFYATTLISQLMTRHIGWEAVMGGIPYAGYAGNWYPGHARLPVTAPSDALYAKKHDPFMLFPALATVVRAHVVSLVRLRAQLRRASVPRFVWVSPDLCQDMHGQPVSRHAVCPVNRPTALVRRGNAFLARWVPAIERSPAFRSGPAVIFLVWDERGGPEGFSPAAIRQWFRPGPGAPSLFGIPALPLGGGRVPLIVITNDGPHRIHVDLWADHYSLLKTIEAAWHLPFLGHAADRDVPTLWPFFWPPRR